MKPTKFKCLNIYSININNALNDAKAPKYIKRWQAGYKNVCWVTVGKPEYQERRGRQEQRSTAQCARIACNWCRFEPLSCRQIPPGAAPLGRSSTIWKEMKINFLTNSLWHRESLKNISINNSCVVKTFFCTVKMG